MLPGVDGTLYLMRPLSFFHSRLRFNPNTRGPPVPSKLHSPLLSFHRCYSSLRLLYTYIQITLRPFLTTFPPSIAEREGGSRERMFDLFLGLVHRSTVLGITRSCWMRVIFSRKCEKVSRIRQGLRKFHGSR